MNAELEIYKQYRIIELKKAYANAIDKLNNDLKNNLTALSKLYTRNKQYITNSLIATYNKNVSILSNRLIQDINKVKAFTPVFTAPVVKRKRALLIGVNYIGTPYELSGCIEDTARMADFLSSHGFTDIKRITDNTEVNPTKTVILREFQNMISSAKSGDVLVFYFSGHGSNTFDYIGDEVDHQDEMIISSDLQAVIDDEFKALLSYNMKEGVTLFGLFDSCFSGTMFDLKYNYLDSSNYDKYTENDKVSECNGNIIMISGCMDSQTSSEAVVNDKVQGAVTWAFLETMNANPTTSWRELLQKMRDLLKSSAFTQIPQMSTDSFYNIDNKVFL
jgi:hypothetical protein